MNRLSIQITLYYIAFIQDDQMKPQELFEYNGKIDEKYVGFLGGDRIFSLFPMILGVYFVFSVQKASLIRCLEEGEGFFCFQMLLKMIPSHDGE